MIRLLFFAGIALFILLVFVALLGVMKMAKDRVNSLFKSEEAAKNIRAKKTNVFVSDSLNYIDEIDLQNSISITQYGNKLLRDAGDVSGYMLAISNNSLFDTAQTELTSIFNWKKKSSVNKEEIIKSNFLVSYLKDRMIKQVSSIEENIVRYESLFKKFDNVILNAEKVVAQFKPVKTTDPFDTEQQNSLKANIELLKNKILNLQKGKVYHLQSITQLKMMLALNNKLIVEFDNIKHHLIPVLKNKLSLGKLNEINFSSIEIQLKEIDKIKTSKV